MQVDSIFYAAIKNVIPKRKKGVAEAAGHFYRFFLKESKFMVYYYTNWIYKYSMDQTRYLRITYYACLFLPLSIYFPSVLYLYTAILAESISI